MKVHGLTALPGRRSLREEVAQALRAAIVGGQIRPGTVYSAPNLAIQFGVSATPVREAILDLAKEGLITIVKNKGFRISPLLDQELDEITEIRELLEVPTVASLQLDAAEIAELEVLAEAIVKAARVGDIVAYIEADTRYHLRLLSFSGNKRLVEVVADLRNRSRLYGLDSLVQSGQLVESAAEHVALTELLAKGKSAEAGELMRGHMRHVRGIWAGDAE